MAEHLESKSKERKSPEESILRKQNKVIVIRLEVLRHFQTFLLRTDSKTLERTNVKAIRQQMVKSSSLLS